MTFSDVVRCFMYDTFWCLLFCRSSIFLCFLFFSFVFFLCFFFLCFFFPLSFFPLFFFPFVNLVCRVYFCILLSFCKEEGVMYGNVR